MFHFVGNPTRFDSDRSLVDTHTSDDERGRPRKKASVESPSPGHPPSRRVVVAVPVKSPVKGHIKREKPAVVITTTKPRRARQDAAADNDDDETRMAVDPEPQQQNSEGGEWPPALKLCISIPPD